MRECCTYSKEKCYIKCGTCTTYNIEYRRDDDLTDTVRIDIEKCSLDNVSCTNKKEGKFKPNSNHICYYDSRDESKIYWSDYTIDPNAAFIAACFFFSVSMLCILIMVVVSLDIPRCMESMFTSSTPPSITRPLSTEKHSDFEMELPSQDWELEEILSEEKKINPVDNTTITIVENISRKGGVRYKRQIITKTDLLGNLKTSTFEHPLE